MQPAYMVEAFVRSELPLTGRVMEVLCLKWIVVGTREPSKAVIEAFVNAHTRNVELLMSSVTPFDIPDELL